MGWVEQQNPDLEVPPWRQGMHGQFPGGPDGPENLEQAFRDGGPEMAPYSMPGRHRPGLAEMQHGLHDGQQYNMRDHQHHMRMGPDMGQIGYGE